MTRPEELKAALDAADAAWAAARAAAWAAADAAWAAERAAARDADASYEAYQAELEKTKEQAND